MHEMFNKIYSGTTKYYSGFAKCIFKNDKLIYTNQDSSLSLKKKPKDLTLGSI